MTTTTIQTVVDVAQALSQNTILSSLYMFDDQKARGTLDMGTPRLKTVVEKGDRLVWTLQVLECEVYAAISGIQIDPAYCKLEWHFYEGTNIVFWTGEILKTPDPDALIPYSLEFTLSSRTTPLSMPRTDDPEQSPCLIGGAS